MGLLVTVTCSTGPELLSKNSERSGTPHRRHRPLWSALVCVSRQRVIEERTVGTRISKDYPAPHNRCQGSTESRISYSTKAECEWIQ